MHADIIAIIDGYISRSIMRRLLSASDYYMIRYIILVYVHDTVYILSDKYRYNTRGDCKYIYKCDDKPIFFREIDYYNVDYLYHIRLSYPRMYFYYDRIKRISPFIKLYFRDYILEKYIEDDKNYLAYLFNIKTNITIQVDIYDSKFEINIAVNNYIYISLSNDNIYIEFNKPITKRGYSYNNGHQLINKCRGIINIWHYNGAKLCAIKYDEFGYYYGKAQFYLPNGQQFAELFRDRKIIKNIINQ